MYQGDTRRPQQPRIDWEKGAVSTWLYNINLRDAELPQIIDGTIRRRHQEESGKKIEPRRKAIREAADRFMVSPSEATRNELVDFFDGLFPDEPERGRGLLIEFLRTLHEEYGVEVANFGVHPFESREDLAA